MNSNFLKLGLGMLAILGLAAIASGASLEATRQLSGHVPPAVARLAASGRLNATNRLHLAIGLPLHNAPELTNLLEQVVDPASPNYRHYLSPEEFTARFGPSAESYQAVLDFARSNGLTATVSHPNRMLVEVDGLVPDVERAFKISLNTYQHPTENRQFYAANVEPSVPASLPVKDVGGLTSYYQARPRLHLSTLKNLVRSTKAGSGPYGSYMGNDFRAAYVPGTTLTGAGQKIALFQWDGYLASDIALYEQQAGLPSVSLTNVLLQGFSGIPTGTGGEVEVSLDIEMCISMAPGISQIIVYEGDPFNVNPNVVLNRIATDNAAKQVSCSWGWGGGPSGTTDQIFQEMILQGQSFFDASGDACAFLPPGTPGSVDDPTTANAPSDCPYITQVGATTLTTTGPAGSRVSETVWNWGISQPGSGYDGVGSSGGISGYYTLPTWQQGIGMVTNHGSTTFRNLPDVALTGDNVFVIADNGTSYPGTGGTSCAAPLWAGFTALVNQQAALNGQGPVGFLNPALYALGKSAAYTNLYNDITTGNNTWSQSPTNFPAVPGFDLATGWGTPNGTNLIIALASGAGGSGGGGGGSGGGGNYGTPIISAPLPPWGTSFTNLLGTDPNGPWFLFVQDTKAPNSGIISNGWFITLTTANPVGYAADNQVYTTPGNLALNVGAAWNFKIAVTNYGPSTSTNVFVTNDLPVGLTLATKTATWGTLAQVGNSLSWTLGNLTNNQGAWLSLSFTGGVAGVTYTNSAGVVSYNTTDPNPDDDSVVTTAAYQALLPPSLLALGYTRSGGFQFSVTNSPGQSVVIQGSTNLLANSWVNLSTNTQPFTFTTFDYTNYVKRFYRAVTGP